MATILHQISTPLQLAALFLILVAGIARLLLRSAGASESAGTKRLVINRMFVAALVALVLGTLAGLAGPVLDRLVNGDEVFHVAVRSQTGEPVPDATVDLVNIASQPTNALGQVDINVPRNRVRQQYEVQVRAPGFQTSAVATHTDGEMRDLEVRLAPAKDELIRALQAPVTVGQFLGAPVILADFKAVNDTTVAAAITDIRASLTGSKGTFQISPLAWSIMNSTGPFYPIVGPVPIPPKTAVEVRVVFATPINYSALDAQTATLQEYKTTRPCTPTPTGASISPAGFQLVKAFAEEHFAWYPGDWKLQLDLTADRESKSFNYGFSLSPEEVAALRNSINLVKQCISINLSLPFAQDGMVSNFVLK